MKIGWEESKLGDLSIIDYGYTAKASDRKIGPKYLRITDINNNDVEWETVPYCKIEKDILKYELVEGDIVFARTGASTGKSLLINNPPHAIFASYLIRVRIKTKEKLSANFLQYFFQSEKYWNIIKSGISGSAQGGFNATKLSEISIPLPPLPEQQRIVALLDQAFAAIEIAQKNTEKNLQNARELFDSYLNEIFSIEKNGWQVKKLGDFFEITSSKRVYKSDWKHDGVPFYRAREIIKLAKQDYVNNELYISEDMYNDYSRKYGIPKEGDLMVTGVGTLGICYVVKKNDKFYFKDGNIIWFKKIKEINSHFIEYAFLSNILRKQIDNSIGATVGTYTIIKARNSYIPFPPLIEQQHIVDILKVLSSKIKSLDENYRLKITDLVELKQSIMQKAFTGEL